MRYIISKVAVTVAALTALGAVCTTQAAAPAAAKAGGKAGNCVMAGGTADMITEDLARFMANAAMNNQMKAEGRKPSGPISVVCKTGYPVNCTSKQRACK